jgi:hypothetical protein
LNNRISKTTPRQPFLAAAKKNLRPFIAFLDLLCYETSKNAIQKLFKKQKNRGKGIKKNGGAGGYVFFVSPGGYFSRVAFVLIGSETPRREGRQKKNPEKTTYICASSQRKVRTYLFLFFSAFLGVSRQGEFENTQKKM